MRDLFDDPAELIERVYAYVAYRVGAGADAEDITSAAIERAFRYRDGYRSSRGSVVAWIVGIARREISEHFAEPRSVAAGQEDEPTLGVLESDAATRLDLRDAVSRLGERDRELIALRYGADLTSRRIGELLDMRTNAVEVALHRALKELREALGAESTATIESSAGVRRAE